MLLNNLYAVTTSGSPATGTIHYAFPTPTPTPTDADARPDFDTNAYCDSHPDAHR